MTQTRYVRWFNELRLVDVPLVGGKNASLGELYAACAAEGVRVPNGFALVAAAYREALAGAGAEAKLRALLDGLDLTNMAVLSERAAAARKIVYEATGGQELRRQIIDAYGKLQAENGVGCAVAVRSSATAEDLPNASFAGQHESYLNIRGDDGVVEACRRCFASLFTDRAIVYRVNNGFDYFKVALSVGVMRMIRSDLGASGVMFTLDTESGYRDAVFITGVYGLGETIVQGQSDPDEFYVHKPTFKKGYRAVLSRRLGKKQMRMVYADVRTGETTHEFPVSAEDAGRYCVNDAEVLKLAEYAIDVEDHYSKLAGQTRPMDIEWAKDGDDGLLYIVQARPETVVSQRAIDSFTTFGLTGTGPILATGRAVGERIVTGKVRVIANVHELGSFHPGEVLVADTTSPDWEPVMKTAAAIVTNRGGRTCHAAIIARELGIAAVVGAADVTQNLKTGTLVTVSCAEGDVGHVYEGAVAFETHQVPLAGFEHPKTAVMVNLGNPDIAFRSSMLPNDGVGLARMEFIIGEHIGVHPMALAQPEKVTDPAARAAIAKLVAGYAHPADFFIERLAEGVGTIAAAFYPKQVIVRLSDFKTNEYASLLGGGGFEPKEANRMLGFRGASRYAHPAYAAGFALECAALRRVREEMGLVNLCIMVPFCRRVDEGKRVIETMAAHGLKSGDNGLEIYVMCEIPNNVIQIDAFSALFDGFSIGSNDLTQLTLGVDRDSEIVAFDFDEADPGMLEMFRLAITGAKRNGRHVGICGEAPANNPEIAKFLAGLGIDSISVNPGSLLRTMQLLREAEAKG